jgi:hypothetical protein
MLHETGRALRDQPSLIAVVGESSMVESSVSGQGAKAESSHSTIGLLNAADNPLQLRINHSIACQLTLLVHCSTPILVLGKRKRLRPQQKFI